MPAPDLRSLWLNAVTGLGAPFGREDSVKLEPTAAVTGRMMVGFHAAAVHEASMLEACRGLEMPAEYEQVLRRARPTANAVLFGFEPRAEGATVKAYLEFWDRLRRRVRDTGSREPGLLHLGVKWEPGHPQRHGLTRYICHPQLSPSEAIGRMTQLLRGLDARLATAGAGLVGLAIRRSPRASFTYLEAEDDASPRRSYDINLYKAGLTVADALPFARLAAQGLGLAEDAAEEALNPHAGNPLGHISGGQDRNGRAFMTWYYEIEPMPKP